MYVGNARITVVFKTPRALPVVLQPRLALFLFRNTTSLPLAMLILKYYTHTVMVFLLQLLLTSIPSLLAIATGTSAPGSSLGSDVTILFQNDLLGEFSLGYVIRHFVVRALLNECNRRI